MQNVFLYDLLKEKQANAKKEAEKAGKIEKKRRRTQTVLAEKYKERIQEVLGKITDRVKVGKPVRSLSTKHFVTNYSTEKERIQNASEKNQWFDTTPMPKPQYLFRKRDRSKEISTDMHYRPTTTSERIREIQNWQSTFLNTSSDEKKFYKRDRSVLNYHSPISYVNTLKSLNFLKK